MTVGVPVNLPKTAAAKVSQPKQPVVISIDAQGQLAGHPAPQPAGESPAKREIEQELEALDEAPQD